MLTYATYSEAGGVGKTTFAANLAKAHADHGHNTLVVDLDPQDGSLSYLLGTAQDRSNPGADTLVHHMIDKGKEPFDDLVTSVGGFDVLPSHNRLEELGDLLGRAAQNAEALGESFSKYGRLRYVLQKNNIPDEYDVLIVDPPATSGPHLYNAIDATRSLVVPVEPSGKGGESVSGLESVVAGIEDNLGFEVGVLAAIVNRYEGTNDQQEILEYVRESLPYPSPVTFRKRSSLFEGCWSQQCTARTYVEEHRDRERAHEQETLAKLDELATFLEERGL